MSRIPSLLLSLLLSLGAAPAMATLLGDASVAYRAERTVTVNGKSYAGVVFHTPGHDRHEQKIGGIAEVIILDAAAKQGFLVLPALRQLRRLRLSDADGGARRSRSSPEPCRS